MKRIDNETENSSTIPTTTTTTTTNLSGATYVLYLEYLGGLIPLLTAKRVSKICPDFIIFDPQIRTNHLSLLSSSKLHSRKKHFSSFKSRSNTFHNMPSVPQTKFSTNNNNNNNTRSSLISNRNSIYVADNGLNNNGDDLITNKSSSGCSSENDSEAEEEQQYDGQRNNLQEKRSRKKSTSTTSKIVKHKHVRENINLESAYNTDVQSNIWEIMWNFCTHINKEKRYHLLIES